ncbi:hypothetical protein ACTFIR_009076 [Dictyostelium discoideum]
MQMLLLYKTTTLQHNNSINNIYIGYTATAQSSFQPHDISTKSTFQYDNLIFNNKDSKYKISFSREFSIIKIKESIINDYFKFNLFLNNITINDFKEIKKKFENNQLVYNRILVDIKTGYYDGTSSTTTGPPTTHAAPSTTTVPPTTHVAPSTTTGPPTTHAAPSITTGHMPHH